MSLISAGSISLDSTFNTFIYVYSSEEMQCSVLVYYLYFGRSPPGSRAPLAVITLFHLRGNYSRGVGLQGCNCIIMRSAEFRYQNKNYYM
jgi:hypothetical protein